ncbi:MAG: Gfo/Idh/MocA family oxidoreductase [Lentisphaeria bacterium]|nr:Gfo/Idh/MocA family oxidoreductase [Lentisphaeria bacterium]
MKFNVGVIGTGITQHTLSGVKDDPRLNIQAFVDLNEEKLKETADKWGATGRYQDAYEMIDKEDLDIVYVATPNKFHAPISIYALENGAHVFCEKPMAINAKEAKEMQNVADRVGKRIMINHSFRFTEQAWQLKKEVDSGTFGDIYFGRTVWHRRRGMPGFGGWFGNKEIAGGGPLIDLGVHRLDMALWLMGYPKPVWVMGSTYDHIATRIATEQGKEFTVEDLASAMIKFENGGSLIVEASWASNRKENEFMVTELYGTEGGLIQRNLDEGYAFEAEIYLERNGAQFDSKLHPPVPAAEHQFGHFMNCIENDVPHISSGNEGIIVMELLDAIYKSAEIGEPVRL